MTIDAVAPGSPSRRSSSSSSTARPAATCAGSPIAAASSPTSCSRSARRRSTTAGCGCRWSGSLSGSRRRASRRSRRSASPTTSGAGPSAGFRAHLRAGATTGTLKLVGIPLYALLRTRSLSGALLVALSANALNQLDTRPGRALKAFAARRAPLGGRVRGARRRGRPARSLRSPGDGDARGLGIERARRHARFEFRGVAHGTQTVVRDRGARRPHPPRRVPSLGALIERRPCCATLDGWAGRVSGTDEVHLRHRRRRLVARQGDRRRVARPPAQARGLRVRRRSSIRTSTSTRAR